MTDTFCSFTRNVTFVTCFLLPTQGSPVYFPMLLSSHPFVIILEYLLGFLSLYQNNISKGSHFSKHKTNLLQTPNKSLPLKPPALLKACMYEDNTIQQSSIIAETIKKAVANQFICANTGEWHIILLIHNCEGWRSPDTCEAVCCCLCICSLQYFWIWLKSHLIVWNITMSINVRDNNANLWYAKRWIRSISNMLWCFCTNTYQIIILVVSAISKDQC